MGFFKIQQPLLDFDPVAEATQTAIAFNHPVARDD